MKIERWSIWRVNLDPVIGSEQGKSRPALVISDDEINGLLNIVNILPITTRKGGRTIYPNEALLNKGTFGLENESIILCHQIRTVEKRRQSKFYGQINDTVKQQEVIEALFFQLGIEK